MSTCIKAVQPSSKVVCNGAAGRGRTAKNGASTRSLPNVSNSCREDVTKGWSVPVQIKRWSVHVQGKGWSVHVQGKRWSIHVQGKRWSIHVQGKRWSVHVQNLHVQGKR